MPITIPPTQAASYKVAILLATKIFFFFFIYKLSPIFKLRYEKATKPTPLFVHI